MSLFVRHTATGTRRFPRTTAVFGFVLFSGLAHLQTLVNLNP
ncbi:MAG TPA: hypothetical protein VLL08_16560 [Kineosporiaceae bacterium]|nr:hypothetical protein [Kineosporiaceae bacterium]